MNTLWLGCTLSKAGFKVAVESPKFLMNGLQGFNFLATISLPRYLFYSCCWILGECRTLWGEREQAACILATEDDVSDVAEWQRGHNSCRKFVVAHFWCQFSWVYSMDYDVSITFQPFLPGLVCSSLGLSATCSIPGQAGLWTGIAMPIFFCYLCGLTTCFNVWWHVLRKSGKTQQQTSRGQRSFAR